MSDDQNIAALVHRMSELLTQAERAEKSIDFRAADDDTTKPTSLRNVEYRGTREISTLNRKHIEMFAVSVVDGNRARDIMFCRTPELAKFIAMLLRDGEAAIAAFYKSLEEAARMPNA